MARLEGPGTCASSALALDLIRMAKTHPDTLNRIAKLFVDRHGERLEDAERLLATKRLILACGPEIRKSATLQAALLTAANVSARCFPHGVFATLAQPDVPLLLPWRHQATVSEALAELGVCLDEVDDDGSAIAFGTRRDSERVLQVTFDNWVGAVTPAHSPARLAERDGCRLAGVLAGALAVAEVFLSWAAVSVEATRREVGFSLWRPDLPWKSPDAVGPVVQRLPGEWWSLGLGHLGQAYLWSLGLLPYPSPEAVNVVLNDHERVVEANVGTGMLTCAADVGRLKTRVAAEWLEARAFRPRLIERRFDDQTHPHPTEPALALGGFDGDGPRTALDRAGFQLVVDCGLGGRADDFDALQLHTLPNPRRSSSELWPIGQASIESTARLEELVERTPLYREVRERLGCGHLELAGRSVAAPFVGAVASAFVVAEVLRVLHGGQRFEALTLSLESPHSAVARPLDLTGTKQPRLASMELQ